MSRSKYIWWGMGLVAAAIVAVICQWPDGKVHVIACDVGQGDATLVTQGFDQVLVDGGPNNGLVINCLSNHMPFWDRQLELVTYSHPQADHIGGLLEVIRRYRVKMMLAPNMGVETTGFRQLHAEVKRQGVRVITAADGQNLKLRSLGIYIYWPEPVAGEPLIWQQFKLPEKLTGADQDEVNNQATVMRLTYKQFDVLFTGDIESATEAQLAGRVGEGIEVLKVAHHGSKTSSSLPFLNEVKPRIGLIEVGQGNSYGLPNGEVLNRLKELKVLVKRTDVDGETEVVSDGRSYYVVGE